MKLIKLQMQSFTEQTMAWTVEQVKLHRKVHGPDTDYWNQVGLVMTQLSAMTEGFNAAPSRSHHLPTAALFIMNMAGDMDDLLPALERRSAMMRGLVTTSFKDHKLLISPQSLKPTDDIMLDESKIMDAILNSHCSAIVKVRFLLQKVIITYLFYTPAKQCKDGTLCGS